MSKLSLIKLNKINQKMNEIIEENDLITENIDFDNNFINPNLSFDNYFNHKDEYFDKDFIDNKNEDNIEIKNILSDLNKNIELNITEKEKEKENDNSKECQEIINILKKPLSHKNIRYYNSPFKPLLKPRQISMVGKVFYNIPNDGNNTNNNTKSNTNSNTNSITTENAPNNNN